VGACLQLGEEAGGLTGFGDPPGQRRHRGEEERTEVSVTPWMYVLFGAMLAAIIVILIILL
jgi:hypothetical protein